MPFQSQKHIDELVDAIKRHFHKGQAELKVAWKTPSVRSKLILYAGFIIIISLWLVVTLLNRLRVRKRLSTTPPSTPHLEKRLPFRVVDRTPGEWSPSPFRRPTARPYPSWSIHTTKPLPYRPFRYGPKYNITMGLRTMHWDDWIELDNEYLKYHSLKASRIAARGEKCCKTAPEARGAAIELLEELCGYLPERYPTLFETLNGGGKVVKNLETGEVFDITSCLQNEDPMQTCARLVQDDLAIMVERLDGQYYLLAGAILLAGFWRLQDKFGMPLSEIHTSGDVPQYKEKLEKGMLNMFKRLQPEKPVLRNNYFIQVDDNLAWSESLGSEDEDGINWASAAAIEGVGNVYFRSERQSLRRLPKSGGIVFTIRTYFHPVTEICKEPYVPGRLASAMRSWGDDVSRYKGKAQYADVLLNYLDMMHERQVEEGLNLEKEDEARAYPY
ncbi:hypothetical protein EKO04_005444 [Ascochyta lentis]|uniref:Mannosyl transferase n=1 Tax=Ascochyta lentis TaxID=205686 RepID=A0A8H7J1F1_9PLEO|nr:hypothetical protein EKO04_005444 [Ascochyta lentis]